MGKVASRDTPAGELIWKRLYQEVEDSLHERSRYTNRSAFVAADAPNFDRCRDRYLAQGMAVVVVYPNDTEQILHPPAGAVYQRPPGDPSA